MSTPASMVELARAAVARHLTGSLGALGGFPVGALFEEYIVALESPAATSPQRAAAIVDHVLTSWIEGLDVEIGPAAPNAADHAIRARNRLADTRGALMQAKAQLAKLERLRIKAAASEKPLFARFRPAVRTRLHDLPLRRRSSLGSRISAR